MHDCLFRNRASAAWVAFGDFDEYMLAAFKPPSSIRTFLHDQMLETPSPPWISHGGHYFFEYCEQPLWGPSQRKFAVEILPFRLAEPMCHSPEGGAPLDQNKCPEAFGRRKDFVDPRKVRRRERVWG
jgi:hypothetical protein